MLQVLMRNFVTFFENFVDFIIYQALFPDTTYGVDSGGDPRVIPKLTFEEFKVCLQNPVKYLLH